MAEENLVIQEIFSQTASRFPEKTALQVKKGSLWQRLTYKELEEASLQAASFLLRQGFKKNDFALVALENRPEWAIIHLGIMYAGLIIVPLDPQLSQAELKNLIKDSTAKIIFCSYEIFSKKFDQGIGQSLDKIVLLDAPESNDPKIIHFSAIKEIEPDRRILPKTLPQDIAALFYTSGTTALPKGVLLSHRNICSNFRSIEKLNICFPSDNFLCILPLHHTFAFTVTLISPLLLGAQITYFPPSLKLEDLAGIAREAKVSILTAVPQLLNMLHKAVFKKINKMPPVLQALMLPVIRRKVRQGFGRDLRLLVSGGARLTPKIGRDLSKLGIKLVEGYGLTETSPVVTLNPPENVKFGSVGKPIADVQIMILEPDKRGIGEVLIKGPNVTAGYFKQPRLTAEVIKNDWFYSGDLGYIDQEGYLFLTGRKKDVIVLSSGENIYPEDLEAHFSQSPYIKEICILPKREEKFGYAAESLFAVVVPDLEYFRQKNEADIRGKIRWELEGLSRHLASYKHIMGFAVIKEELPRTALRKIKRYQVMEQYLGPYSGKPAARQAAFGQEDSRILRLDTAKKIINYISSELKKPVDLDSHLEIDLGIDSLTRVELGLGLEALLSLKIPDEALYSVSTVREVILKIIEIADKTKATAQARLAPRTWGQLLNEAPEEKILKRIRIRPRAIDKLLTFIFKDIFLSIFRLFWLLRIEGRANLPSCGPYLICPNHASYLDGFVVFSSLPLGLAVNAFFLGYSDIFEQGLFRWSIKLSRLIPVNPDRDLTGAMQAVSFALKHNKIVCIFPEGRRCADGRLGEFKKGVGVLIKELDIPVVPVYIKGSHQSWPRANRLPGPYPIRIVFGRPLRWKNLLNKESQETKDIYEAIAGALKEEVSKLERGI